MSLRHVIAIVVFGLPLAIFLFRIWLAIQKRNKTMKFPLGDVPRPAGYSLQKRLNELNDEMLYSMIMFVICSVGGGIVYVSGLSLWWSIAVASPFMVYFMLKLKKLIPQFSNYNLGLVGEQAVGAVLNTLSRDMIKVFHDFPVQEQGKKPWNIDHIVVTLDGVFVLETKTRRKPVLKGNKSQNGHEVRYDGGSLHYPMSSENWGINQALRNANWMADYLSKAIGEPVSAKPVLVLPGWMVRRDGKGQVNVVNHKELYSYFSGRKGQTNSETKVKRRCHQLEQKCMMDL